jgi:CRP/FNR family cyclic AMP-dependent transcriptional regulator
VGARDNSRRVVIEVSDVAAFVLESPGVAAIGLRDGTGAQKAASRLFDLQGPVEGLREYNLRNHPASRTTLSDNLTNRMKRKAPSVERKPRGFDVEAYLDATGGARKVVTYRRREVIFSQGDPGYDVRYLQKGAVKLSVLSHIGKEAVVAMLVPGDFFGEGVLAGQAVRIGTATAVVPSRVLSIEKEAMIELLHNEPSFSDRFISYMLARNIRIEADLVDQLFNSSEKRLARTLLLLARYGGASPQRKLPKISQETLAEMIGTTRARVNFFMNKFRKLGLIEYNGGLKINSSLLSIVLHD